MEDGNGNNYRLSVRELAQLALDCSTSDDFSGLYDTFTQIVIPSLAHEMHPELISSHPVTHAFILKLAETCPNFGLDFPGRELQQLGAVSRDTWRH